MLFGVSTAAHIFYTGIQMERLKKEKGKTSQVELWDRARLQEDVKCPS